MQLSLSPTNGNLAREGLSDPDPMVRISALDMLEAEPPNQIWRFASPLLSDPSRGVRIRAASLLAVVPTANQPPADRERFERAAAEFINARSCYPWHRVCLNKLRRIAAVSARAAFIEEALIAERMCAAA